MIVSLLPVPALLIRMSAPPNAFSAAATSAAAPSAVATSQATATVLHAVPLGDAPRLFVEAVGLARRDDDVDALLGERLGDGEPDADAGAGDHRDLVAQMRDPCSCLPRYLTIGIFDRSMVMATAAISTAPKTMFWAKMLTPRKVMPMRTTEMISAPTSVRQMLPTPPVIAVPPTTTAAIEGSSSSAASVGEPLASRPARTTPASAAKAAERTKAMIFWRSTLTPEA